MAKFHHLLNPEILSTKNSEEPILLTVSRVPWYSKFHGDRINDHHTTLAEKVAASEEK